MTALSRVTLALAGLSCSTSHTLPESQIMGLSGGEEIMTFPF